MWYGVIKRSSSMSLMQVFIVYSPNLFLICFMQAVQHSSFIPVMTPISLIWILCGEIKFYLYVSNRTALLRYIRSTTTKILENMDAEKGYLQGRFDAVPIVQSSVEVIKKLLGNNEDGLNG